MILEAQLLADLAEPFRLMVLADLSAASGLETSALGRGRSFRVDVVLDEAVPGEHEPVDRLSTPPYPLRIASASWR